MFLGIDWKSRLRAAAPQMIVGAIIGTAALALAFRGVDWQAVGYALTHIDLGLTLLALLSVGTSIGLSVARWWLLFATDHRAKSWSALAAAILVGQTANIVVPVRVGELARMYLIGTREHISKTRVMATIVIEKVTDLMVFAVSIAVLLVAMSLPRWLAKAGAAFVGTTTVIVVTTILLTFWSPQLVAVISHLASRLPGRWHRRVLSFSDEAISGLRALRGWRRGGLIWLLSCGVLLFSVATNYIVFAALGLSLRPVAALFVAVALRIGQAPPSLPGKIGLFQYSVVLSLAVFGINRTTALTYAFALYAIAILPVLITGTACAIGFRWTAPPAVLKA